MATLYTQRLLIVVKAALLQTANDVARVADQAIGGDAFRVPLRTDGGPNTPVAYWTGCYGAVGIGSGNLGYPVSSVEITGNHFTSLDDPIRVSDAQSVTITNNYAETIGCNGDYSANGVTLTNDGPSTVTGNTFPRAGKVAVLSSTPVATVCQNRLTATALFDQPVAC
jgi:hypothetical protein